VKGFHKLLSIGLLGRAFVLFSVGGKVYALSLDGGVITGRFSREYDLKVGFSYVPNFESLPKKLSANVVASSS